MRVGFLTILLIGLIASQAFAVDDWFCTESSSRRLGNEIQACGVAKAGDEGAARLAALDVAKAEFSKLCDASYDCKGHKVTADPRRTTCEPEQDKTRCYRLVAFTIEPSPGEAGYASMQARVPASLDGSSQVPKIGKGMKKSEVIAAFGEPPDAQAFGDHNLTFIYRNAEFCENTPCTVGFLDGKVVSFQGFYVKYTHLLEDKPEPGFFEKLYDTLKGPQN